LDALMVARPLHSLVGMLPQQALLRVPEGETYVPRTFEFPM